MVEFIVRVPADTPDWEPLFLAGDADALGEWRAAGVRLHRRDDGTHRARVQLPAGATVRFLITRGTWRSAESDGHGRERPPHELLVRLDTTVEVTVAGWGRDSVKYHPGFASAFLRHARPVSVHLPPGYDLDELRRFPVFYLHDGQNLFDAHTSFAGVPWAADEVAEREARRHAADPVILVGVGNSPDRMSEYGIGDPADGYLCDAYGDFLVRELRPFIDATYRTAAGRDATGIGGSSLGGIVSLYLARRHPDVFGRCAAVSPSLWWEREAFLQTLLDDPHWPRGLRFWVDFGDSELGGKAARPAGVARTRKLARHFTAAGLVADRDYAHRVIDGGTHDEASWHARFDQVVRFLFPPHSSHAH